MFLRALFFWSAVTTSLALWPQPFHIESGSDVLWIQSHGLVATFRCSNRSDSIVYESGSSLRSRLSQTVDNVVQFGQAFLNNIPLYQGNRTSESARGTLTELEVLRGAVVDVLDLPARSTFVPWKLHPRGSHFEPNPSTPRQYLSTLTIQQSSCPSDSNFTASSFFNADESYELRVATEGAFIKSNSTIGTLRALQTFNQLFYAHSADEEKYTPLSPLMLVDKPRWSHRGISVDIARNPFKPEDLIRTIDVMSTAKLNRLHVHATDSQSWPIDIPALPELARKGAYQPHLVWTAEDVEKVQRHGVSKGVSVFIEIDMPGHTAAVAHAYPDLIAAFNELDWNSFAAEPLSGQLKLNSAAVTQFVTTLLHDLLSRTSPYTTLYHLGGDEVNTLAYLLDETVSSKDPNVLRPLLQKFFDTLLNLTQSYGLQPIVWEEMLLEWNLTLPSRATSPGGYDTLVQVWRSSQRIEEVLERGHRAIFGDYSHWYLDCGYGQFLDPYASGSSPPGVPYNTSGGQPSTLSKPYLDYCNPYHNWRHIYMYDPLQNVSAALQAGIEGGEVLMWSEQTDSYDLDTKLWPRAAAAAEVLWAGVRHETMIESASKRLGEWRERVVTELHVPASPVHMTWCLMEGGCNL